MAFAAIAIGALVPAAIMSIAAANPFTRNIYREYLRRRAEPAEEARVARLGWLAGMVTGSLIAAKTGFETSTVELSVFGVRFTAYAAVTALVVNLIVATLLTPLFNALKAPRGRDITAEDDYEVEAAPPIEELAEPEPEPVGARRSR